MRKLGIVYQTLNEALRESEEENIIGLTFFLLVFDMSLNEHAIHASVGRSRQPSVTKGEGARWVVGRIANKDARA